MSQLMILLSLYCLQRSIETDRIPFLCGAGMFAALSAAMRPSNVLFVLISGGLILLAKNRWRLFTSYAAFGLVIGAGIASYNFYVFDHIRGGYQQNFTGAFASGLPGILFSPGRGLFFYSPILLLAIPGVYFWFRQSSSVSRIVYLIAALFAAAHILLYSQWPMWWGGHCFGPRLLTDITPCLARILVYFFRVDDSLQSFGGGVLGIAGLLGFRAVSGEFQLSEGNVGYLLVSWWMCARTACGTGLIIR